MDQQFSLSWNNFHGNLSKGFEGLLGNGEFVDVTIAVEGHLLQAHKVILSICSPYFKKMFQLNPCQHPIVVLRDVSHKAMKDLLQFMYHGEVSVKREDLTSFIGTAEVLQIKGLTNKETDDENDKDVPTHNDEHTHNPVEVETSLSETFDTNQHEDNTQNESLLTKQRQFIEKLQRFSNLKRKSEEFLQKNYYTDILTDKRPKIQDKPYTSLNDHSKSNYELKNSYDESPLDVSKGNTQKVMLNKETNENFQEQSTLDSSIELKTECEDMDIIVTDPAVCAMSKSYDGSRDGKRDGMVDYDSPQDNCTSLNSLFMDLKNLVNGKVTKSLRSTVNEDLQRNPLVHSLVTIPQKEDGKKKYPQRSCRLCWKMGRRRDTRFMCNACELPFCKTPCFDVHYNEILKSQIQVDYYAT